MRETDREAVERVRSMEAAMDALQSAWDRKGADALADPAAGECLRLLTEYVDSGQWLADYRLDEAGGLPHDLKRGVLSEDGLYDLFTDLTNAETTES